MIIDGKNARFLFNGKEVGKIINIELLDGDVEDVELRRLAGGPVVYAPGVPEYGSAVLTCYRDTTDVGQRELSNGIKNRTTAPCRLEVVDGTTITFDGYRKSVPITGAINATEPSSILVKITGSVEQV